MKLMYFTQAVLIACVLLFCWKSIFNLIYPNNEKDEKD